MNVVHVLIPTQERGPFRIDHPSDFGARVRVADRSHSREGMNHVPERTRFYDQNGFQGKVKLESRKRKSEFRFSVFRRFANLSPEGEPFREQTR